MLDCVSVRRSIPLRNEPSQNHARNARDGIDQSKWQRRCARMRQTKHFVRNTFVFVFVLLQCSMACVSV